MSDEQGSAAAPMNALPVGTKLAEYVIRSTIGEGGFGIVYLAHDLLLEREVAIKEYLPGSLAIREGGLRVDVRQPDKREVFMKGLRRFVNEAHLLAKFRHPALLSVLRYMEANGTAYMVMPFYRGKTLRQKVRDGFRASRTEDLFSILLPVLEGLSQLHSVGCYHLDISSDNIMILDNGAPVLLDFGAARHTELSGGDSTTIILKPGFAPVEQYGSDDNEMVLGPWTDIYAISAVAYLLVSGIMPPVSVARVIKDTLKPAVSYVSPDLPAGLLSVIDEGLAVRPSGRAQTTKAYSDALLAAVEDSALPAAGNELSFSAPTVSKRPCSAAFNGLKRNHAVALRWSILVAALLAFAAIALSGCSALFDSPPGTEDVHQEATLKAMSKLASDAPQEVMDKGNAAAGTVRQTVADTMAKARSGALESGNKPKEEPSAGREIPRMTFERFNADMPQLAVWGLDEAAFLLDDEPIELGKMTRAGRLALVAPGRHRLQVKCPSDPPFSADFYIAKNDRAVLRGRCSSEGQAVAGEERRN